MRLITRATSDKENKSFKWRNRGRTDCKSTMTQTTYMYWFKGGIHVLTTKEQFEYRVENLIKAKNSICSTERHIRLIFIYSFVFESSFGWQKVSKYGCYQTSIHIHHHKWHRLRGTTCTRTVATIICLQQWRPPQMWSSLNRVKKKVTNSESQITTIEVSTEKSP